jgi:hypothetical protein
MQRIPIPSPKMLKYHLHRLNVCHHEELSSLSDQAALRDSQNLVKMLVNGRMVLPTWAISAERVHYFHPFVDD